MNDLQSVTALQLFQKYHGPSEFDDGTLEIMSEQLVIVHPAGEQTRIELYSVVSYLLFTIQQRHNLLPQQIEDPKCDVGGRG